MQGAIVAPQLCLVFLAAAAATSVVPVNAQAAAIQGRKSYSLPLGTPCATDSAGHLATADFNGDGRSDIVFIHSIANVNSGCHAEWGVLLNQGKGQFQLAFGPNPVGNVNSSGGYVALGDFNRDGHMDIVVGVNSEGTFHLFLGDGAGSFTEHPLSLPYRFASIADIDVADSNGDGIPDIGVVDGNQNYGALIYVGDGAGNFTSTEPAPSNDIPSGMRFLDVDNNGTYDVVMINTGHGYDVAVNDGHGNYSARPGFQDATTYNIARVGDMDGDGKVDLITNTTGAATNVQKNTGAYPYFNPAIAVQTGASFTTALRLPDFDGDGKRDILAGIVGGPSGADLVLLTNTGNAAFAAPAYFTTGLAAAGNVSHTIDDLLVRDLDGDGKIDIAAIGPSELAVFLAPLDRIFKSAFEAN